MIYKKLNGIVFVKQCQKQYIFDCFLPRIKNENSRMVYFCVANIILFKLYHMVELWLMPFDMVKWFNALPEYMPFLDFYIPFIAYKERLHIMVRI